MSPKRILIVNCHADECRKPVVRANRIPQSLAHAYLAGACSSERCDVRIYNELASGPFRDTKTLAEADMLVLTGLNTAYDRMRLLAASARSLNPRIVVVAGGPAVSVLPRLSRRYFDYACTGDVEQLGEVLCDVFGPGHAAEIVSPRMDMVPRGRIAYIETSRNCRFRCSFCTLSTQRRSYRPYVPEEIRRQVRGLGYRDILVLLDNNFYSPKPAEYEARLATLRELYEQKCFGGWAALVSSDFFTPENLREARRAGCIGLFSGVETFDTEWLRSCRKPRNGKMPQVEQISSCLESGILFLYGMMMDVTTRHLADLRAELDFIVAHSELSLPGYIALPIPILGTPYFDECVAGRRLLPNIRLRDMDIFTLCMKPLDTLDETVEFVREIESLAGRHWRALRHTVGFARRYFGRFNNTQRLVALGNAAGLCVPVMATSSASDWFSRTQRTHVAGTEVLDPWYTTPDLPVAAAYANYLTPTIVTDEGGNLTNDMAELANHARLTGSSCAAAVASPVGIASVSGADSAARQPDLASCAVPISGDH